MKTRLWTRRHKDGDDNSNTNVFNLSTPCQIQSTRTATAPNMEKFIEIYHSSNEAVTTHYLYIVLCYGSVLFFFFFPNSFAIAYVSATKKPIRLCNARIHMPTTILRAVEKCFKLFCRWENTSNSHAHQLLYTRWRHRKFELSERCIFLKIKTQFQIFEISNHVTGCGSGQPLEFNSIILVLNWNDISVHWQQFNCEHFTSSFHHVQCSYSHSMRWPRKYAPENFSANVIWKYAKWP